MAFARPFPFVHVNWLAPVLASDRQCWYQPWLKSHFKLQEMESDFDLAAWKVEHAEMVEARRLELEAEGWQVFLEDQTDFKLNGQTATVSGKCDLVAVRGDDARVEDCKSGQQRGGDFFQVLEYMLALPLCKEGKHPSPAHLAIVGKRLTGAVVYRASRREIQPEEFTAELRQRIVDAIKRMGDPTPPAPAPSAGECRFCRISAADCTYRIDAPVTEVRTELF